MLLISLAKPQKALANGIVSSKTSFSLRTSPPVLTDTGAHVQVARGRDFAQCRVSPGRSAREQTVVSVRTSTDT